MGKIKDLTGQRFGKLVAIKPLDEKQNNKFVWLCKCDCGNETNVIGTQLTSGNTKSCGCLKKKHGMFGTRLYNVWHSMKERCYVESTTSYKNYGARGIKVCNEWQDFIPFMEWALDNGYDENATRGECTLDRIDSNGDYEPYNCRWVNMNVQANNKNTNVYIDYNGVVDTLSNHSRKLGLDPRIVESRKCNGDKTPDRLFRNVIPPKTIEYKGKQYKINDLCKKFNISRNAFDKRVFKNGQDAENAINDILKYKSKTREKVRNRSVLQYDLQMNYIKRWNNVSEITKETGFNGDAIRNCCLGYAKTSSGYIWRYIDEEG